MFSYSANSSIHLCFHPLHSYLNTKSVTKLPAHERSCRRDLLQWHVAAMKSMMCCSHKGTPHPCNILSLRHVLWNSDTQDSAVLIFTDFQYQSFFIDYYCCYWFWLNGILGKQWHRSPKVKGLSVFVSMTPVSLWCIKPVLELKREWPTVFSFFKRRNSVLLWEILIELTNVYGKYLGSFKVSKNVRQRYTSCITRMTSLDTFRIHNLGLLSRSDR